MWLRGKGSLKKDKQQFGDWMRAELLRPVKKSVATISGRARSQAPWWRKAGSKEKISSTKSGLRAEAGAEQEATDGEVSSSFQEVNMEDVGPFKPVQERKEISKGGRAVTSSSNSGCTDYLAKSIQGLCVVSQDTREPSQGNMTPPTFSGLVDFNTSHAKGAHVKAHLGDSTNQLSPLSQPTSLKTFKKLACNYVPRNEGMSIESVLVKRSVLNSAKVQGVKRQRVLDARKQSKENIQVEIGS